MRTPADLDRITHDIIGAAIEVHRDVGPGCFEKAYAPCLAYELAQRKLDFRTAVAIPLRYRELLIARAYEADFIVEDCVLLELKAITRTGRLEERQLQTYLRLTGCPLGLILNFGAPTMAEGITRRVNNFPDGTTPQATGTTDAVNVAPSVTDTLK